MSTEMNQHWTLARKPPEGWPTDGDFAWGESPIPTPGPNQMLTRTIYRYRISYRTPADSSPYLESEEKTLIGDAAPILLEDKTDVLP